MNIREMVPWKWGELHRGNRDEESYAGPRQHMEYLHREMNRLFDSLWNVPARGPMLTGMLENELVMPVIDEVEDDMAFHVSVELPGMDEKDVDITLSDRFLTIRGNKKQEEEQKGKDFYRRERNYGSFRRTIELPGEADVSRIEASFRKGVLTIDLPKTKEAQDKVRHIDIKAA